MGRRDTISDMKAPNTTTPPEGERMSQAKQKGVRLMVVAVGERLDTRSTTLGNDEDNKGRKFRLSCSFVRPSTFRQRDGGRYENPEDYGK
ncbi:hypothetical protein Pmani_039873 [Petrolisthes manimaculis]|uniref:Uncharacterized protein n=1 Tax=Petrolisthes manimaculis TaxID=1843537 RepID=A0AAE1NDF3_9EUCA|nr:hypothetical protein Pmani_039873 [Petrolisthes manimaculis]